MDNYFTALSTTKPAYPCDQCESIFTFNRGLKKHKILFHRFIKCLRCQGIFNYHYFSKHKNRLFCGLQITTTQNSAEESAEYHCPLCSMTFLRLSSLKKHIDKHTNANPVRCKFCGQIYLDTDLLSRHIQLKHISGKQYHECDTCNKLYKCRHKFQKHKIEHKYELVYPYICIYCRKKCEDLKELKKHLKIEHGTRVITRNMTCHVCQKPRLMKYHLGTSHIYVCRDCEQEMIVNAPFHKGGM